MESGYQICCESDSAEKKSDQGLHDAILSATILKHYSIVVSFSYIASINLFFQLTF